MNVVMVTGAGTSAAPLPTRFRSSGSWVHPSSTELPRYQELYAHYSQMDNEQLLEEERMCKAKYRQHLMDDDFEGCNQYVAHHIVLSGLIDYGFRKYEKVHRKSATMWIEDVILSIDGNCIKFRSVLLPPGLVRKITDDNMGNARKMVSYD